MTPIPDFLTAGNAHSTVATCFSDAGCPGAQFTIAEGDGTVAIITGAIGEPARQQIQERLQAIVLPAVKVTVKVRT